jgi:hypothetical protein
MYAFFFFFARDLLFLLHGAREKKIEHEFSYFYQSTVKKFGRRKKKIGEEGRRDKRKEESAKGRLEEGRGGKRKEEDGRGRKRREEEGRGGRGGKRREEEISETRGGSLTREKQEATMFELSENYPNKQVKKYSDCGHHFHLDGSTVGILVPDVFKFFTED